MNEEEWADGEDTGLMLESLQGKMSDRKLRLVLCAWCRCQWKWLSEKLRAAVELAERFSDDPAFDNDRIDVDADFGVSHLGMRVTQKQWLVRFTLSEPVDLLPAALSG